MTWLRASRLSYEKVRAAGDAIGTRSSATSTGTELLEYGKKVRVRSSLDAWRDP